MRRLPLALAALLALGTPPASAQAQEYRLPGTRVSVALPGADDQGATLYISEINDTLGKTFVQFRCVDGQLVFGLRTKVPLLSERDLRQMDAPAVGYRVDGQTLRLFPGVLTRKAGALDPYALSVADSADARFVQAFQNAVRRVEIRVERIDAPPLTLSFGVRGFREARRALNCG